MGCACSRSTPLDKGTYSIYNGDSPGNLVIQIVVLDLKSIIFYNKVQTINDNTLKITQDKVRRMEQSCQVLENGFLFSFNEIEFDDARIELLFSPISFEIDYNENFYGKVTLKNLKYALFSMSKEEIFIKNSENEEIKCEVYYAVSGSFFYDLRTLKLKHLTEDEQLDLLYNLLKARNDEGSSFGKSKLLIRLLLGDFKTEVRVKIFERLVEIPGEKSSHVIKEFLLYFNPYQYTLQHSFKNFMKNAVSYDEGLEKYAINLIEFHRDDYLIYENKESLILILKQAFYKGEDPKEYFSNLLRNTLGVSDKMSEIFKTGGIFENIFVPAFERNQKKAIKICDILLKFSGFEEFLAENWKKLDFCLNLDEVVVNDSNGDFMEFAIKMKEEENQRPIRTISQVKSLIIH